MGTSLSNHSHEALRVIELAVGVDDLGPRLEGQPATRADQVLHVRHAENEKSVVQDGKFQTQLTITFHMRSNFAKTHPGSGGILAYRSPPPPR